MSHNEMITPMHPAGPSFSDLSAPTLPWAWNGPYFHTGKGWFGGPCPSQVIHDCRPPWLDAPTPPVPEPSTLLMLALGMIAVYLWSKHVRGR